MRLFRRLLNALLGSNQRVSEGQQYNPEQRIKLPSHWQRRAVTDPGIWLVDIRHTRRYSSPSMLTRALHVRELASDPEQLQRYGLPVWYTEQDLAAALDLSLGELWHYASYREYETTPHYYTFTVPKRSGGERTIIAPKTHLKAIQHKLNKLLISQLPVSDHAHGFRRNRSIRSNAEPHIKQDIILGMDIKDFFPSVHIGRVRGYFIAMGYSFPVATTLALLMTEAEREVIEQAGRKVYRATSSRYCVQGAPTSPGFCNALLFKLDRRLAGVAQKWGFAYTRYADDVTFSGADSQAINGLSAQTTRIIRAEGFKVNAHKTRIMRQGQRQQVAGVIVNQDLGLSRQVRRQLRAGLHRQAQGLLDAKEQQKLKGQLAYLKMLNPEQYQQLSAKQGNTG